MKNRDDRLMAIRRLISNRDISSQEELQQLLEKQGFTLTQATLSRDLKYLRVAKMPHDQKGYIYVMSTHRQESSQPAEEIPLAGFVSIDFAQGMGIMKTLPGHAGSIAYALDELSSYEIAGTIAGDDTILIIPRDGVTKHDILSLMKVKVPGLEEEAIH